MNEFIDISEVLEHKIGKFLCWPQYDQETALDRIKQLESLEVQSLAMGGPHNIQGTQVLGKGHSGVVIRAWWCGDEVALRIRRTDADRTSMKREAEFLVHVNQSDLGPKFYGFTRDFILMEKLVGLYLDDWVKMNVENRESIKRNIKAVLDIAWRLDQSGLDHGELTRIKRHYIITEKGPRVIDFESASFDRPPSNLTSTIQSLFINYRFMQVLGQVLPIPEIESLLPALKTYKQEPNLKNYQKILDLCSL